jgi:hypothetical protein
MSNIENINKDSDKIFERNSDQIFKYNTKNYTESDFKFLRYMNALYGNALSAKGLNLLDPLHANFFHYNKLSMRGNVDLPRTTRTYVFFTRPELNFSFETINSVPFFKWLYSKRIGKMIFAALTDPNYFINAPAAMNAMESLSSQKLGQIMNEYSSAMLATERKFKQLDTFYGQEGMFAGFDFDSDKMSEFLRQYDVDSGSGSDDAAKSQELMGLDMDTIPSTEEDLKAIYGRIAKASGTLQEIYKGYQEHENTLQRKLSEINKSITGSDSRYDDTNVYKHLANRGFKHAATFLQYASNNVEEYNYTSPFIPLLSNTCTSVTGAQDFNLESFEYETDRFGINLHVPTGMDSVWNGGDLQVSFEDMAFSPVSLMMMVWVLYIHLVSRGMIVPTRQHITERILDYTTSIYVFVIGDNGRRIERWARWTGCYPTNFPLSEQIQHNTQADPEMLHKININFKANYYSPMDPEVLMDFNFLSETEWMYKLKEPLWENLYNRNLSINNTGFVDMATMQHLTEEQKNTMRIQNRPETLWEYVTYRKRGMSGRLPATLVDNTISKRKISSGHEVDIINDFWGGYPYVHRGTDLIWVTPNID